MADQNPTSGRRTVTLDLPPSQLGILRSILRMWLSGVREDLKSPERLRDAAMCRREAEAYERLLAGIGRGALAIPDEEAHDFLAEAAKGNDEDSEYALVKDRHEALYGLLARLEREAR
jgi:hypothetical protein